MQRKDRLMKKTFVQYYIRNRLRSICNKAYNRLYQLTKKSDIFNRKEYLQRKFIDIQKTNEIISGYIQGNSPFLVARYGATELNMLEAYFERKSFHRNQRYRDAVDLLCETAGFFPNDEDLAERFVHYMIEISSTIDLLGIWNLFMEDFICEQYVTNAEFTRLRNLEPYYANGDVVPWSAALKGKKVLVIHPFSESIEMQYKRRKEIWTELSVLPEFELITVKAVQTMAEQQDDRFCDWFEALEYMLEQCKQHDFDIALIGCGAYGFPLAAEIKKMGKGAIHLGGALQILFGIKGKRWDTHPIISSFYNDAWIRPIEQRPKGYNKVEDGCYW